MVRNQLIHVVDDEDSVRRSLDFMLRADGFRVERWSDGEKFLKGANDSTPACVLLDIGMPGLDGLGVQTRMGEAGLDFPVILLTGHGDISIAIQGMRAGAFDFLQKPFDRKQLLGSIEIAFNQMAEQTTVCERSHWACKQLEKLTKRELEVLDGLACGYPNSTIAYDLGVSSQTIELYRASVMSKLDVSRFADALRVAFAAGLGSESLWFRSHPVERS